MAQTQVVSAPRADQEEAHPHTAEPKRHVRRVPQRQGPTIEELVDAVQDDLLMFSRAYAGYNSFLGALHTLNGTLPEGERPRGLQVLTHPATVNGRDSVEVHTDLKRLTPEYANYVLPPLIYLHGGDMLTAIQNLSQHAQQIEAMVTAALSPQQGQSPPAPHAGAPQGDEAA